MKTTKLLTSACVIIAGLYGGAFAAPSVRAISGNNNTGASGAVARAGTLRVQNAAKSTTAAPKKTSTSTDSARLASLPGIVGGKISTKLPAAQNASAIADLRNAIEELSLTTTSTTNALSSVQSGLDKLTEDYEQVDIKIQEAKDYTDTTVDTLKEQKIRPLETDVAQVALTASNAATKSYVDQKVDAVSTTAFNETQVNAAINSRLATENYKGYADTKVANVISNRIVPLENAVDGIDVSVDMQVSGDEIQYKSGNATTWKKLADKSTFVGQSGVTPIISNDPENERITVQYGPDAEKQELVKYAAIKGPKGDSAENVNQIGIEALGFYTKDDTDSKFLAKTALGSAIDTEISTDDTPLNAALKLKANQADLADYLQKAQFGSALTDAAMKNNVKTAVLNSEVLNGIQFQTTEEEVQYSTDNGSNWKKLAAKSEFAGLQGEQGEPGQDACRDITSEYTPHNGNTRGFLTITVTDSCQDPVEVKQYKQEDDCVLASLDYESATTQDIYSCTPQAGTGGNYTISKNNGDISAAVKTKLGSAVAENTYLKKNDVKTAITTEMDEDTGVIGAALKNKANKTALDNFLTKNNLTEELAKETNKAALKSAIEASGALDAYADVASRVATLESKTTSVCPEGYELEFQQDAETANKVNVVCTNE